MSYGPRQLLKRGLSLTILTALLAILAALVHWWALDRSVSEFLATAATFGSIGLLIGGIYAFDQESDVRIADKPLVRAVIGAIAGGVLGVFWQWPIEALVASAITGGCLGLLGMAWAKYVHF